MPDELNPYRAPERTESRGNAEGPEFGAVVSRGFSAAHRAPTGAAWIFLLLIPTQALGAVMNSVMFGSDFFSRMQRGDVGGDGQVPPEMMMLMGAGCVSCVWMPVMLFGLPWIWGGIAGQIRDRLLDVPLQSFHTHGKRYYITMLALLVLFVVAVIVVSIPGAIVNQLVAMSQATPGRPMDVEGMRALALHPANIAASILGVMLMTAVSTIVYLIASTIVAGGYGLRTAFSEGFALCRRHSGDVARLFGVYILLILPFFIVQWGQSQLTLNLAVGLILSILGTLYLAYVSIASFGLAGSLVASRRATSGGLPTGDAEQPS